MILKCNISLKQFGYAQVFIILVILILGFAGYLFQYFDLNRILIKSFRLFDVGREQSIPTMFSVLNLLLSCFFIFIIYLHSKRLNQKKNIFWLLLSITFFFLAIDEAMSIHEKLTYVQIYFQNSRLSPHLLDTHQWLPLGVLFVIIFAIIFIPFLKSLETKTILYFSIAAFVFLSGAIGFEFLGAVMLKTGFVESKNELIYMFRRILEEGFEMYGIAIFNIALYREILNRKISLILGSYYSI